MDGYALRVSDCSEVLQLNGQSLAGHPSPDTFRRGECVRITTGARVPDAADAVIQQENVSKDGNSIIVNVQPESGLNIRLPGTDSQAGQILIRAGHRLGPSELALIAAHGLEQVEVLEKLNIALFSTGDELVNPGQTPAAGQIFDANRPLILNLLSHPGLALIDLGICSDSESALQQTFTRAAQADLVISSGGVSVGDADFIRTVLEQRGTVDLWKIAMKPGRPLTFGFSNKNQPYFGLPGNPVSSAITCLLFVLPAIKYLLGMNEPLGPPLQLPLKGKLSKAPGRVEYQRAIMENTAATGAWHVSTTGLQDSHVLSSLHKANCLIELPLASSGAVEGDRVNVYPFTHFGSAAL